MQISVNATKVFGCINAGPGLWDGREARPLYSHVHWAGRHGGAGPHEGKDSKYSKYRSRHGTQTMVHKTYCGQHAITEIIHACPACNVIL